MFETVAHSPMAEHFARNDREERAISLSPKEGMIRL